MFAEHLITHCHRLRFVLKKMIKSEQTLGLAAKLKVTNYSSNIIRCGLVGAIYSLKSLGQ